MFTVEQVAEAFAKAGDNKWNMYSYFISRDEIKLKIDGKDLVAKKVFCNYGSFVSNTRVVFRVGTQLFEKKGMHNVSEDHFEGDLIEVEEYQEIVTDWRPINKETTEVEETFFGAKEVGRAIKGLNPIHQYSDITISGTKVTAESIHLDDDPANYSKELIVKVGSQFFSIEGHKDSFEYRYVWDGECREVRPKKVLGISWDPVK